MDPSLFSLLTALLASLVLALALLVVRRRKAFHRSMSLVFLKILVAKKESDSDEKKETQHDFKAQIGLMEQLLAALKSTYSHKILRKVIGQEAFSFEYVALPQKIFFFVVVPRSLRALLEKYVVSFYPDAVIEETEEINIFENRSVARVASIKLSKSFFIPIRTYQKLESDPINNLLSALGKLAKNEATVVQFLLRPVGDDWQEKSKKLEKRLKKSGSLELSWNPLVWLTSFIEAFTTTPKDQKKDEQDAKDDANFIRDKAKKTGYEVNIRIIVTGVNEASVEAQLQNVVGSFSQFEGPGNNRLKVARFAFSGLVLRNYVFRYFSRFFEANPIFSTEEIASLFHFPHTKYNRAPEIQWQNFKLVKSPANIPTEGILLGTNVYRGETTPIYLKNEDRFRHFYVIGQTGTGKTSILTTMARQDIRAGKGIAVIDPHGDFANEDLIPFIPKHRADDLIYFNPADLSRPLGINMLEAHDDDEKQRVAQDAMNIMLKLYGNEIFGPRIQDYFRNGVLTLMDYPGGSAITDIIRLFTDDNFQQERRRNLRNPVVKAWWDYTFAKMGEREKGEIIPYFSAKFGGFITNTMMRNIIGQVKSSFDIFQVMQEGKILMVNLSKGLLGDFNSNLLGLILVSKIQMAAMRRQTLEKSERPDFFLYIDEFQNYVTDSIESILSEARKYRLGMTIAHQYLGQLEKSDALKKENLNLKGAIFGNVGTVMSYKVGPQDAEFLAKQFAPNYGEQDLVNMDKFKAVIKLSIDTQPSPAFSITPTNPHAEKGDKKLAKAMMELSRLKYGRAREFVDKEIIYRIGAV